MLFILIASIAAVAIYLTFLIPHLTTTDFFQSDIRDEAVTTYPLPPQGISFGICKVVFNSKHTECFNSHKALYPISCRKVKLDGKMMQMYKGKIF